MIMNLALQKLTSLLTKDGKREKAKRLVHNALVRLHKAHAGAHVFETAVHNVTPLFELKKVRLAGTTQLVPSLVRAERKTHIALRWIVLSARTYKRKKKLAPFDAHLAQALVDASLKTGEAHARRQEVHKLAEANRAFAHYRWW